MGNQHLLNLGNNIREIRLGKGLKQNEMAKLCKMEKASISRIESGRTNVTMLTLLQIASVLEINFGDLFN